MPKRTISIVRAIKVLVELARLGDVLKGDVVRCREFSSERNAAGWRGLLKGVRRASVARSKRVVNAE